MIFLPVLKFRFFIARNVVEITIKMKTIVRKPLMIKMIVFVHAFGLIWFYGIATIVGYLIQNPVYSYILNIDMSYRHIL